MPLAGIPRGRSKTRSTSVGALVDLQALCLQNPKNTVRCLESQKHAHASFVLRRDLESGSHFFGRGSPEL